MLQHHRIDRRLLYWMARRAFAERTAGEPGTGGPERILIVRVDERMGNLVMLQSLVDALHFALPRAGLGLLCSVRAGQVARNLKGVTLHHAIDKRWFFLHPVRWRRLIREVRELAYPVAIDASAWHEFSFTHAALTYYSGAAVRIGFAHGIEGFHTHLVAPGPATEYELSQRMRLLAPLGIIREPPRLRTTLGEESSERWQRWMIEQRLPRPWVGIWAGSRKSGNRWPVDAFVDLIRKLHTRMNAGLIVLWGPGEEGIRDRLLASSVPDLKPAPPTDIADLTGLLRCLDLVVTNDTGPMHLSVAVGTPTVALFTSSEHTRWGHPYGHVRNLFLAGADAGERDRVAHACRDLVMARSLR